ncbi:MAG: aminotransferase class V-fold PLP-dependent enzyme [Chloroflexi bacterium]|nr:aminotransferase class V-fold PLP-dependent enzyme [Chloroflexota bacterium]
MDPEAFRRYGHQTVDWIADFLAHPERFPVLAQVAPGEVRAALPATPPTEPEPMAEILADFERAIVPGITHWNHPGFFAYFAITSSGPGILGELLAAALNANAMLWRTAPAATELEDLTLDWLRQLLGLPDEFEGVINDTASSSTLYALAAAREAVDGLEARQQGLLGRPERAPLKLYISTETHSSVEKAAIVLGIGLDRVEKVPVDEGFRMDPVALETAIQRDLASGLRPFAVVPTVGTTSTTSIDPVPAIAEIARRYGLWLHVDAAYGGPVAILPERRDVLAGAELADSIVVNPHKWLFTPIDCSVLYCRRREVLKRAFSVGIPIYETPGITPPRNLMDYGTALGRRFRALKLWFILRYFGAEGIRARLREHLRLTQLLVRWIAASPDFELLAPVPFSTICFRFQPAGAHDPAQIDVLNQAIIDRLNATGEVYVTSTKLRGRLALRVAIGNLRTTEAHVGRLWELIQAAAAAVAG